MSAHHPFRSAAKQAEYLARYEERAAAWPVRSVTRLVPTSFGETFVRLSGPEDGPPLVMLPGIGSPGLTFVANAAALSKERRMVAVDNVHDHGRSIESRTHPVTSAADFCAWLDELLDGLGFAKVDLLGLSYGGWISAHYALHAPARVRRLVLLAPAGTLAPIPWGFIWRAILCVVPMKVLMQNFMAWATTTESIPPDAQRLLDQIADDAYLAHHAFAQRRMVPPIPLTDEELSRIEPPTLFLAGDREVCFHPHEAMARLARAAPRVKARLLPGAGHDFFVSRAQEVDRLVLKFLAEA